jgi:dihydrofolate reductase
MPEMIVIAALAEPNRVIGKDGRLPWSIPQDLARFKQLTLNHTVIMGRRTWELDLQRQPLKHRSNVIVSNSLSNSEGIQVARSLTQALQMAQSAQQIFIIGGATIYRQSLRLADRWMLTLVESDYAGDVFFPEYAPLIGTEFELESMEPRSGFRFETYRRISR